MSTRPIGNVTAAQGIPGRRSESTPSPVPLPTGTGCTTTPSPRPGTGTTTDQPNTHHPTIYNANRMGAWITCSCSWKSRTYVGVTGAHLAFGEHLVRSGLDTPDSWE